MNIGRMQQHCNQILESVVGGVRPHRGWHDSARLDSGAVREVALVWNGDDGVVLHLYPGDTISQAREFYAGLNTEKFCLMRKTGWDLRSNLHFAFMERNVYWSSIPVPLETYLPFWAKYFVLIKKWEREHFALLFDKLKLLGQISERDVEDLRRHFLESNRNSLNLCPGAVLKYGVEAERAALG